MDDIKTIQEKIEADNTDNEVSKKASEVETEKIVEQKTESVATPVVVEDKKEELPITPRNDGTVEGLLKSKLAETTDIDEAVNIMATGVAIQDEGTTKKVVDEKEGELRNKAERRRVEAEKERITAEAAKIEAEKTREIADLDKQIEMRKQETELLKVQSDKEQAFFEANKDILRYISITSKKSLKTMKALMVPAIIVYAVVQLLLFPLTFIGLVIETIMKILANVCGEITHNGLKVVLTILVITLLAGGGTCIYYFGIDWLRGLIKK